MQLKKKKKKTTLPTRYTMSRDRRLQSAKSWIINFEGQNLVRGYAKRYRTDLLCAISELRMLGVEIKPEYDQGVRQTIAQRIEQNKKKKQTKEIKFDGLSDHQDSDFAFIAGYTSGGAPHGIRWEEMDEVKQE